MYESGGKTAFSERDGAIRVFVVANDSATPAVATK
jgi:hypothetical protein